MNRIAVSYCKECNHITEHQENEFRCDKCGECLDTDHCHNELNECVAPIEECEDHSFKCGCELHDECACKNP